VIEAEVFREGETVYPLCRPMAELERRIEKAKSPENTIPLQTDSAVKEYLNACARRLSDK
jgi:hypothetical protein